MAKAMDQESLFSLELVVDKIKLPKIICRFPAVAFRLLDFPTLLIYHVQPDLADKIKQQISSDPYYKLPYQLHELQDKDGNFPVKKGKSCLFKVPLETLHNHLLNAPLYVMLIDTYPEVPKLIGSCSVPLDESMQLICNDVDNFGLSVPSVHGERGEFSVYNLMGTEIGQIELGFRLLSLGVGLIPHIQEDALVKFQEKNIETTESKDAKRAQETADIVLRDVQSVDKPIQVSMFNPDKVERIMQTEKEGLQNVETQTFEGKRKSKQRSTIKHTTTYVNDDIFVTNTLCPPPLFYNSEAEPKKLVKEGLTFIDGTVHYTAASEVRETFINGAAAVTRKSMVNDTYLEEHEDNYSEYSDSTIRHEDKFSDTDEIVDFDASVIKSTRKPLRKTLIKSSSDERRSQILSNIRTLQAPNIMGNMSHFPLINALLSEIVNLQGLGGRGPHATTSVLIGQDQEKQLVKSAWREKGLPKSRAKLETKENFLHRLSTPRGAQEHGENELGFHKGKRSCAALPKFVPKNKSWLRKEPEKEVKQPEYGVKKNRLVYGMTNTQRLRLAKGNPELLKTLEKKEQIRIAERRKNVKGAKTETKPRPAERKGKQTPKDKVEDTDIPKLSITFGSTAASESELRQTEESPKRHKRPVPTPRLSLTGGKKDQKTRDYLKSEKERLIKMMAELSHTPPTENESSEQSYHTAEPQHSDRSMKSIEVHLPSVDESADDHVNEDATSVDDTDFEETSKSPLGQTKVISGPGFPRESVDSRLSLASSYSAQYSDDFEDEKAGNSYEEPGLKRVVEQYSTSSVESPQEPSLRKIVDHNSDQSLEGEEPSLRRVVDQYSDSDGTLSGKEPSLRRVVDNYSDTSNKSCKTSSKSYQSAVSRGSIQKGQDEGLKHLPMPNPTSSLMSPTSHHRLNSSVLTREGMAASTPTVEDDSVVSDPESSTARIPRSQIPSQSFDTGTSLDSTGEVLRRSRGRYPRPNPRRSLERIRTESVSSYAPSDPENLSPQSPGDPEDIYSDTFDDESISDKKARDKYVKDLKIPASSKGLGYTWT